MEDRTPEHAAKEAVALCVELANRYHLNLDDVVKLYHQSGVAVDVFAEWLGRLHAEVEIAAPALGLSPRGFLHKLALSVASRSVTEAHEFASSSVEDGLRRALNDSMSLDECHAAGLIGDFMLSDEPAPEPPRRTRSEVPWQLLKAGKGRGRKRR